MTERKRHRDTGAAPPLRLADLISRRAFELLADGEWHSFTAIVAEVAKVIPPGVAIRKTEQSRRQSLSRSGMSKADVRPRTGTRGAVTPEQQIKSGRRTIVRETMLGTSAWEKKEDQVRMVAVPRIVAGDRRRAELLRPVLEQLATVFGARPPSSWHIDRLRAQAHDHGFHLNACPKGCTLATPIADEP